MQAAKRYRPPLFDALLLRGRYEWFLGNSSAAESWWGKALQESKITRDPYAESMVHLEIGSRMGDQKHLRRAEAILGEIGADFDLTRAKEALAKIEKS